MGIPPGQFTQNRDYWLRIQQGGTQVVPTLRIQSWKGEGGNVYDLKEGTGTT